METFRLPDLSVVSGQASCIPDDARWISETERRVGGVVYFADQSVIAIAVGQLPSVVESDVPEGKPHAVQLSHEPYEDHYGHTEVQTFRDGIRVTRELPTTIKTKLRHHLALNSRKLLDPSRL